MRIADIDTFRAPPPPGGPVPMTESATLGHGTPQEPMPERGIPDLTIMCGLAVGYSDPDFPTNRLHIGREAVEKNVTFLDA